MPINGSSLKLGRKHKSIDTEKYTATAYRNDILLTFRLVLVTAVN